MKHKISVIVQTSGNWETLKLCLKLLQNQTLKPREILIPHYTLKNNVYRNISKYFPNVKIVKLMQNFGVTGCKNAGIKNMDNKSDFILFINDTLYSDKKMLEELVETANTSKSIGIVTPVIYSFEEKGNVWSAGVDVNLLTGRVNYRKIIDRLGKDYPVQTASNVMLVKKEVIDNVGGFDEKYYASYEDLDFCMNARRLGYVTYLTSSAVAYYNPITFIKDEKGFLYNESYLLARNRTFLMGKHGEDFGFYMICLPFYFISQIFINDNRFDEMKNHLTGVKDGLIKELLIKRILIHIPYSRINVLKRALRKDKARILDVGCGNGELMEILNSEKIWKVDGVDAYPIDVGLARATGVYSKVIVGDIRKIKEIIKSKKYDIVFCSQVLEHLKKKDSLKLIDDMEKLGKKIVLATPLGFLEKEEAYLGEGDNPYQAHKSAWSIEDYESRGYKVYGRGVKFLFGDDGILSKSKNVKKIYSLVGQFIALLLASFVYYKPKHSTGALAIKYVKVNQKSM